MDVKSKVAELLEKEHHSFSELAEYLNLTEDELTTALNNKTLELRYLEAISKALRVPLYSFFEAGQRPSFTKPYYINRIPNENEPQKTIAQLEDDIYFLRKLLAQKEEELQRRKTME